MSENYFEGYYFKHQNKNNTMAIIPSAARGKGFIQVITNEKSYNYTFPEIKFGKVIEIGGCRFSKSGIIMNTENVKGKISYSGLTPIKSDIMGVFKYFPMECRHGVISMHHTLKGEITIEGESFDFNGGTGYIEKDSGVSFPKEYLWINCNDFDEKCSVMVSIANIPFMGFEFLGCICSVYYNEKEYRLATYNGVKINAYNEKEVVLSQGKNRLEINMQGKKASPLFAPKGGEMIDIIHESNCSSGSFRYYEDEKLVFDFKSDNVSFEYNIANLLYVT